jgi:hypothetical protein
MDSRGVKQQRITGLEKVRTTAGWLADRTTPNIAGGSIDLGANCPCYPAFGGAARLKKGDHMSGAWQSMSGLSAWAALAQAFGDSYQTIRLSQSSIESDIVPQDLEVARTVRLKDC